MALDGLVYYPDTQPGVLRQRRGRGFSYVAPDGTRIARGPERRRIESLGIPPAYDDVWICPLGNGHLQATGRDARRRKQYRYHPDWTAQRDAQKYDQLADFAATLPALRRWITAHLGDGIGEESTAIAAALALIDRASVRVGNPEYAAQNDSYGATTLTDEHVDTQGALAKLEFTAKGGKTVRAELYGRKLARVLDACQDLPGAEVLSWQDTAGTVRPLRSQQVNDQLRAICGDTVTAKTLRTWNGTHAAWQAAMTSTGTPTIKAMAEAASERLHNTPAIARKSYIHPAVIGLSDGTEPARNALRSAKDAPGLRAGEAGLAAFLSAA